MHQNYKECDGKGCTSITKSSVVVFLYRLGLTVGTAVGKLGSVRGAIGS